MSRPTSSESGFASIRSPVLRELCLRFLVRGDEEGFWREAERLSVRGGYPIVEPIDDESAPRGYVRVTFLHRAGERHPQNVVLFANVNRVLAHELLFERAGDSGVYVKSLEVPPAVRFRYRIIEDDPLTSLFGGPRLETRRHLLGGDPDRLNPRKRRYPNLLGEGTDYLDTWVELEGCPDQPHIRERGSPRGSLVREERSSNILGYARQTITYQPPGFDRSEEYPLLIVLDGESYFSGGDLAITLDNLIADRSLPPVLALGIESGIKDGVDQRNAEFPCNPEFADALERELLPWFTSRYRVSSDPAQRVIAGMSYGGLFATYFAFLHPELVANVVSQSGSFHWGREGDEFAFEWLPREFATGDVRPIRLFLEVGILEGEYHWRDPFFPHAIVSHRHFKTLLDMRGYDVTYREYGGGHDMLSWRGGIADGLLHMLGTRGAP